MPSNPWLIREYVGRQLKVAGRFRKRVPIDEFKLLFAVPLEDEKLIEIARELGFRVSRRHRCIVIELSKKEVCHGQRSCYRKVEPHP